MQKRKPQKEQKNRPIIIERRDQFAAINSGVRDQILQVVVNQTGAMDPDDDNPQGVSIREIAHQIGRKPGSLYRHIDTLVEAGLIVPTGAQTTGGRDAQGYAANGNVVQIQIPRDPEALDLLCRHVERSARLAGKESAAATRAYAANAPASHESDPFTPKDHALLGMFGWLDESQQRAIRDHMHAISEIFRDAARRPNTKLIATDVYIRPVVLPDGTNASDSED